MGAIGELTEICRSRRNRYIADWQESGRKIVGYVCTYMPEEILYAADILPVRITGKGVGDTSTADSYLSRVNCSFARCCLEAALDGEYSFLDGVAWVNGCDHIRRCYDNWKAKDPLPFMHMLPVPHTLTPEGCQWYREEVLAFKDAVEKHFDVHISSEKLNEAVDTYNRTRRLLRRLYHLRTADSPLLTGAEAMAISSAGTNMPKTEFNHLLLQSIQEIEERPPSTDRKIRLLVAGSEMDDPEFIENVEDLGAIVVTDSLCFGTRYFWDTTEESEDPLEALVNRYYYHVPCPRMAGEYQTRLDFIRREIERANVDGVILESIKFCDLHGTDNALLKSDLEKVGIATLELERQYGPLADAGRIRTRVQAFLERIGG